MKVYIATTVSFPSGMAATNRIKCYAKGLITNGAECEVITTSAKGGGNDESIPYKRFCKYSYNPHSRIMLAFINRYNVLHQAIYLRNNLKENDVVLFYGMEIWVGMLYWVSCYLKNAKLISELCEIPYYDNKIKNKIKRWIQINLFFKIFDGFIPISEELLKLATRYGSLKAKKLKVPILIDQSRVNTFSTTTNNNPFFDLPYIFYAGTISEHKDGIISSVKAFIEASKSLSFPIYYIIAGPQSEDLLSIQLLATEFDFESKIIYIGNISDQEVISFLQRSTLFISYKKDNIQNRNGFSTKLGEVLVSQVAIITTTIGEHNYYLKDGESAYIVEPGMIGAIAEKIVQAFTCPSERKRIAETGRNIALKEFDCISQGRNILAFLENL